MERWRGNIRQKKLEKSIDNNAIQNTMDGELAALDFFRLYVSSHKFSNKRSAIVVFCIRFEASHIYSLITWLSCGVSVCEFIFSVKS